MLTRMLRAFVALLVLLPMLAQPGFAASLGGNGNSLPGYAARPSGPVPLVMPDGLGWDNTRFPLQVSLSDPGGYARTGASVTNPDGTPFTAESLFGKYSTALSAPGTVLYISPTGNDSNACTQTAKCLSGFRAQQLANAAGLPAEIIASPGVYYQANSPAGYSGVTPTVDTAWVCQGNGRCITGAIFATPSMTADTANSFPFAYTAARAGIQRVMDLTKNDRWGNYTDLQYEPSEALVNATPNSWGTDGTNLWVHRLDGAAPTSANTRLLILGQPAGWYITTQVNTYIGDGLTTPNAFPVAGWDCEGGTGNGEAGCLNWFIQTPDNTKFNVLAVKNSSFKYGGGTASSIVSGTGLNSYNGLAAFFKSRADANYADGFHTKNNFGATESLMLTVDCTAFDNGRAPNPSNQGLTLHNNNVAIDVAGDFEGNHGGDIRNIDTSRMWAAGTLLRNDYGDTFFGGYVTAVGAELEGSAKLWLDRARIDQPGSTAALGTGGSGSAIYLRNVPNAQALLAGGYGTIAGY